MAGYLPPDCACQVFAFSCHFLRLCSPACAISAGSTVAQEAVPDFEQRKVTVRSSV
jgi:hypothetical protein